MMKRISMIAGSMVLALATAAHAQSGPAQAVALSKENRTLEVSGTGEASSLPDEARVHVGFLSYGATLGEAYSTAVQTSNTIVRALNSAGAAKGDIESQGQSVNALNEYELKNLPAALKGMKYRVNQSWTVRTAPEQVAKVLDTAVQAGANQSGQVEWRMKDSTLLEKQAMAKATARARALAEEMASGMGVRLGPVIYVSNESQPQVVRPMPMMRMAAQAIVPPPLPPLDIEAQRIESSVTVHAVYAIE